MNTTPLLPAPVLALLAEAFDQAPVTNLRPTVGGFSNLSARARIGGAPCVVKAGHGPAKGADLRREAVILTLVANRRLGAPELLAFTAGGDWAVLVTRRRGGTPGVNLFAGPPAALAPACEALGRALARLHRASIAMPPDTAGELLLARRAAALAERLAALPVPADVRGPLVSALGHPAWYTAAPQLVHGDAGLHNILWGPRGLTLLDWELAGWGDPRVDLAWAAWALRFRGLPAELWEALLRGYGSSTSVLDHEAMHALALGQIAGLLVRAAGLPAWDEWLRRARATLKATDPG